MGRSYFKVTFLLYYLALALSLLCRTVLQLRYIDHATGFYTQPTLWEYLQNILLAASMILMLALNRLRRAGSDYPVWRHSGAVDAAGVLTGLAILAYTLTGLPELMHPSSETIGYRVGLVLGTSLGMLTAFSFLLQGWRGKRAEAKGYLAVYGCLWQALMVVTRFNAYTTLTTITDNLFTVLFMLFAAVFLLGQARTVSGIGRRNGCNYAIPSGLCMSLCGFILVLPNYIYMLVTGSGELPALMLGFAESAYILMLSIYAPLFVHNLAESIRVV